MARYRNGLFALLALIGIIYLAGQRDGLAQRSPYNDYEDNTTKYSDNDSGDEKRVNDYIFPVYATVKLIDRHNGLVSALATVVIMCFTGVLAYVSYRQAKLSQEAIMSGTKISVQEQRAWVKLANVSFVEGLTRDPNGIAIALEITATNVGSSPAQNVMIHPYVYISGSIDQRVIVSELIDDYSKRTRPPMGAIIFQGDSHTVRDTCHLTNDQIAQAELRGTGFMLPFVVFVINYYCVGDIAPHQTVGIREIFIGERSAIPINLPFEPFRGLRIEPSPIVGDVVN